MKNHLQCTLLFIAICSSLHLLAQDKGGIKGGVNFASEKASSGGVSVNTEKLTLPHFGLYFVSNLSEQLGLQYEVLYSVEGGTSGGIDDKISYLNLPLLLRFNAGRVINFHFGPQLGFKVAAKSNDQDISEFIKETNFSGVFGMGIESPGGISLGVRYALGLTNIAKQDLGAEFRLNSIQLWAGVRIFNR